KDQPNNPTDLIVHEWGTFTSVAGEDGRAIDWRALAGATDLPCFVNRTGAQGWINKLTFMAKVRMETPVLYFYSPRETTVTAKVRFPEGLMTEWYPPVSHKETRGVEEVHELTWANAKVLPKIESDLPAEPDPSHYYTARNTDAAPLRVNGREEKFLF